MSVTPWAWQRSPQIRINLDTKLLLTILRVAVAHRLALIRQLAGLLLMKISTLFRARKQLLMLAPDHLNVDCEIPGRGGQVSMSQEFLDGTEVTAVLQQMCRKARSEKMGIVAAPRRSAMLSSDFVISSANAQRLSSISIDDTPDGVAIGEPLAIAGYEEHQRFTGPCFTPDRHPRLEQSKQLGGKRHMAVDATFAGPDKQRSVRKDIADLKPDDLAGTDACFVGEPDNDVVPEPDQRCQVRRGQQFAHFDLCKNSRQSWVRTLRRWHHQIQVDVGMAPASQPSVPTADRIELLVKRRPGYRGTPGACPGRDGGLVR